MNDVNYHCQNVVAVLVTYNPELATLAQLVTRISPQVKQVIIVDNCSTNEILHTSFSECTNVYLHRLDENFGIGKATNVGIEIAQADKDVDFILLSDQDSLPAVDMIHRLRDTAIDLVNSGCSVAAVGPCFIDERREETRPPFLRVEGLSMKRQYESSVNSPVVAVDYLIASGCLITVKALTEVGMMNEKMFIDYVDTEWGLRAQNKGFQSFGDFKAKMTHSLGDNPITFRGRHYPVHSPLRHYYMTRNAVWLYKQSYIPLKWKIVDGYRLLLRIGFYILYAEPRIKHFRMMMKGLFHGILSRMGPESV